MDKLNDLFVFGMGMLRDAEHDSSILFGSLYGSRVQNDDLRHLLREQAAASEEHSRSIGMCFPVLGQTPVEASAPFFEGAQKDFERFLGTRPSPELLDLFVVDMAWAVINFKIGVCARMADAAAALSQHECEEGLRSNLEQKQESLPKFELLGREMKQRAATATPVR
jgi:ferritin-like metal-binding protein YciE